jgi:hypothetical protein
MSECNGTLVLLPEDRSPWVRSACLEGVKVESAPVLDIQPILPRPHVVLDRNRALALLDFQRTILNVVN